MKIRNRDRISEIECALSARDSPILKIEFIDQYLKQYDEDSGIHVNQLLLKSTKRNPRIHIFIVHSLIIPTY